jgi:hypothetical protein
VLTLFALVLFGCGGESSEATATGANTASGALGVLAPDVLGTTWQVRMAVAATRAPFEGREGWTGWFGGRRVAPLEAFRTEKDAQAQARAHTEFAAAYRQAAVLAAHATVQVYGADAQDTDPAETSYLVGVSGAVLNDATWRAKLGAASASKVTTLAAQDKAWAAWASSGASWPADAPANAGPGVPAAELTSGLPDAGALPHYALPERGGPLLVDAGDPGTLWVLSRWHEARARAAAPESAALVDALLDPWRVPAETKSAAVVPEVVPDPFLFMSTSTNRGDLAFLADLARTGVGAVAGHAKDSPFAAIAQFCTQAPAAGGAPVLAVDCVLDESAALGRAIEDGMKAANNGVEEGFHRAFADFARVGALRAADRVAVAMGDMDTAGRLRINALDRTVGPTTDPVFLASVAAWDAGNRNSVRAEEIVHGLLPELPGLDAARIPLDALHVRLSRNAAPGRPMH